MHEHVDVDLEVEETVEVKVKVGLEAEVEVIATIATTQYLDVEFQSQIKKYKKYNQNYSE